MNTKKLLPAFFMLLAFCCTNKTWAYSGDAEDVLCKDPKFRDFNLPTYDATTKQEVPAESELSFTVSSWANPETLKVTAKKNLLDFSIENRNTFYIVTAKLPPTLNGKFVRVNVSVNAVLGCVAQTGWLLKVAQPSQQVENTEEGEGTPQAPVTSPEDPKAVEKPTDQTEPAVAVDPAI